MTTAQPQPGQSLTFRSSGDLSATQYRFADLDASNEIENASAGGRVIGVRTNSPAAADRAASVTISGTEWVELGGTVTAGPVKSDSVGRAVAASAQDVIDGQACGLYVGGGTASGERAVIQVMPNFVVTRASGVETLTGAGEASVYTHITELVATSDAITLPDGLYVGQRKILRLIVGSTGSNTITPDTVTANTDGGTTPASFTATDIGQEVEYEWRSDGWKCVRLQCAGVETVADAGTANPLKAVHNLAVSGTDDAIIPSGIYPGQESFWWVISAGSVPVQTISGLFYMADGSATGIDVDLGSGGTPAAGDHWRGMWTGARWRTVGHLNAAIST